jgi:predicted alpha/beta-hydrolase family hydrolase
MHDGTCADGSRRSALGQATPEERIAIAVGDGTVSGAFARPDGAFAALVLAHGAGAGLDHPFMTGFSGAANDEGLGTLRFNFPYMEAGRRTPDRAPAAIAAWGAVFDEAVSRFPGLAVWAGGKSYGGRIASMGVAEGMPAAGLVFLGYPLHPPGKPDRVRDEHLYGISVPMLFLEGTADPFATPEVLRPVLAKLGDRATLHEVEGGGHSFEVRGTKRDPRAVAAALAPVVAGFMRTHAGA